MEPSSVTDWSEDAEDSDFQTTTLSTPQEEVEIEEKDDGPPLIDSTEEEMLGEEAEGMAAEKERREELESRYQCNICLDVCTNPVVTRCGHLFDWPCIHQVTPSSTLSSSH